MQVMEKNAFSNKEKKINKHIEKIKYKDLELLRSHRGPFTAFEEVDDFLKKTEAKSQKEDNKRMYIEVSKGTYFRLRHSDPVLY